MCFPMKKRILESFDERYQKGTHELNMQLLTQSGCIKYRYKVL
jgi:hypothetical protein